MIYFFSLFFSHLFYIVSLIFITSSTTSFPSVHSIVSAPSTPPPISPHSHFSTSSPHPHPHFNSPLGSQLSLNCEYGQLCDYFFVPQNCHFSWPLCPLWIFSYHFLSRTLNQSFRKHFWFIEFCYGFFGPSIVSPCMKHLCDGATEVLMSKFLSLGSVKDQYFGILKVVIQSATGLSSPCKIGIFTSLPNFQLLSRTMNSFWIVVFSKVRAKMDRFFGQS